MGNGQLKHLVTAGVLVALASLTACSGDSSNDAMSRSVGSGAGGSADDSSTGGAQDRSGADRTVVRTRSVVVTGEVAITAKDLAEVRAEVDDLLGSIGGSIGSEHSSNDRDGAIERSTLVLRVPVDSFEAAKDSLMHLGRLKNSDESSKDVTTEVIDVDERVQTLRNSLDDLQRFQRGAKDVADLLDFEQKITARQSDLQSLKAQQAYLADQTSLATITLYLSTPEKYVPPPDALQNAGFLSGLTAGWHGLVDFVVVMLTVLGAVLPFLVAGLLVGVPAGLLVRVLLRRRRAGMPPAPAES